jgi:hypothetical protein
VTGTPQAGSSDGITVSTSQDFASAGAASQALGGQVLIVSSLMVSDDRCPLVGQSYFVAEYLVTRAGSYRFFAVDSSSSLVMGPWSLIVYPSAFCSSRSSVVFNDLVSAGQSVHFTVRSVDAYYNVRSFSNFHDTVILFRQSASSCFTVPCIIDSSQFVHPMFDSDSSIEAIFYSNPVTSTGYDSVSVLSIQSFGLLATFYDGANLFESTHTKFIPSLPLSHGFNFHLTSNSRNVEFGQDLVSPFATRFCGLFIRHSAMMSSLTHSRANPAFESIKIVIGGITVLDSPAGSGAASQTFSLIQFPIGLWLDFLLEYSAANVAIARTNSLSISSGMYAPSDIFASPFHFRGSPFFLSVAPSLSDPKSWRSEGHNLLQAVSPSHAELSYHRKGAQFRNMTVVLSPRDRYGNMLLSFPDLHFFYLGTLVQGEELPFAVETHSYGHYRAELSLVSAPSSVTCFVFCLTFCRRMFLIIQI